MKFKVGENLSAECADELRSAGYDAETVGREALSGTDDDILFEHCKREGRILLTLDLDFSNVRTYPPGSHYGIVVLRPRRQDKHGLLTLLKRVLTVISTKPVQGRLWIVEPDRIRIREQ